MTGQQQNISSVYLNTLTFFFSYYKINDSANMKLVMKWSSFSYNVYTDITLHVSNQYL